MVGLCFNNIENSFQEVESMKFPVLDKLAGIIVGYECNTQTDALHNIF